MKTKTGLVFSIMILMIITQGCAGRASYQFVNKSLRPSEYSRFFDELDSAVYRSGARNGAYFAVPGFPYLRADRFLVSLKDRLKNDAQKDQWVRLMQQLDIAARKTEIQTLPASEVEKLAAAFALKPERRMLQAKAISYSHKLLAHDQRQSDFFEVLEVAVQNSSEYSTLMRIFGLYPLASIPVAIVTLRVNDEIAERHQLPEDERSTLGTLTVYGPNGGLGFSDQEIRKIMERSKQNPLRIPLDFMPYELEPYQRLEMLPKNDTQNESMFTARGIGKYSERIESDIFIPMGVPQVGRMRQRGHHAIKFVGRAHFDDPYLFDKHFEFK